MQDVHPRLVPRIVLRILTELILDRAVQFSVTGNDGKKGVRITGHIFKADSILGVSRKLETIYTRQTSLDLPRIGRFRNIQLTIRQ